MKSEQEPGIGAARAGRAALLLLVGSALPWLASCSGPFQREEVPVVSLEDLGPIPSYGPSDETWTTSAVCAVYPMFGAETQADSASFMLAAAEALTARGVRVVPWANGEYMWHGKRSRVDTILRLGTFRSSTARLAQGRSVSDLRLLVEVLHTDGDGDLQGKRLFDVWARTFNETPAAAPLHVQYQAAVENLFRIRAFREALYPHSVSFRSQS